MLTEKNILTFIIYSAVNQGHCHPKLDNDETSANFDRYFTCFHNDHLSFFYKNAQAKVTKFTSSSATK
jgi:hypothetical protein